MAGRDGHAMMWVNLKALAVPATNLYRLMTVREAVWKMTQTVIRRQALREASMQRLRNALETLLNVSRHHKCELPPSPDQAHFQLSDNA